jgi:hypothetical protein
VKLLANSTLLHAFLVLTIPFVLLFVLFARMSGLSISLQCPSAETTVMLGLVLGTLAMGYMVFFTKHPETLENMFVLVIWFVWLHLYIYAVEIASRLLGV